MAILNGRRDWNRRCWTAIFWAVSNLAVMFLQNIAVLNIDLAKLYLEKSSWVAGLLIAGITGTDAISKYVEAKPAITGTSTTQSVETKLSVSEKETK
jgi:hypothetical protein